MPPRRGAVRQPPSSPRASAAPTRSPAPAARPARAAPADRSSAPSATASPPRRPGTSRSRSVSAAADRDAGRDPGWDTVAADPLPDVDTAATACRRAAAALTPRARHGEGVTVSGAGAAALADLFRALAAGQEHAVPDTAC